MRAETLGASADGTALAVLAARSGQRPLAADRATTTTCWRARTLPAPMTLTPTSYSGRPSTPDAIVPLRPTGRNEPFTFELAARDARIVLAADPLNRIAC